MKKMILKKDLLSHYKRKGDALPKEEEVDEATDSSSSGSFDVPLFAATTKGGRKDPLAIGGEKTIKNSRAVTDKKFPKWGGPEGVYVTIKRKFNEGQHFDSIKSLGINEIHVAIKEVATNTGISYKEIEKMVLNEINSIFIKHG